MYLCVVSVDLLHQHLMTADSLLQLRHVIGHLQLFQLLLPLLVHA